MDDRSLKRITAYVIGTCAALSAVSLAAFGLGTGLGALAGGAIAVANWFAMRWVGRRLMVANDKGKAVWGALLALKMAALLGVIWAVLSTGVIDPTGFAIGLSGLPLGALLGALHTALSREGSSADAQVSEES
jgi:hypothetical protein